LLFELFQQSQAAKNTNLGEEEEVFLLQKEREIAILKQFRFELLKCVVIDWRKKFMFLQMYFCQDCEVVKIAV